MNVIASTAATAALVAAVSLGVAACAHAPLPQPGGLTLESPPTAGDSTLALWTLDESTGLDMADSSAAHRDGVFGVDTRPAFGRFRNARQFTQSINSFAIVAVDRAPELGPQWTIEAWVNPTKYGSFECSVLACRWTELPNEQCWMLGVVGYNRPLVPGAPPRTNLFDTLIPNRGLGLLLFALQPEGAGDARAFTSTVAVELDRWTHVAVSYDGRELRMYVDGRLNAQYANASRVRQARVPLVIGNQIDPRLLTESQGPLRIPDDAAVYPFYAFEGAIDEMRISSVALGAGVGGK